MGTETVNEYQQQGNKYLAPQLINAPDILNVVNKLLHKMELTFLKGAQM